MKKKAFFSLFVAMLLSFGMMAKSSCTTAKVNYSMQKEYKKTPRKTINVSCLVVQLSCMRALACGSTGGELVRDAIRLEGGLCGE
ncbi:MAG: hypothetical protein U5N85_19650 [Arcicella sp.]|nr:hypothetical protein [Arcicella sp.]